MLLAIGADADDGRVERTVRDMLARKAKVPGFGHRVYRTEDPRATHLRRMSRRSANGRAAPAGTRCRGGSRR